MEGENKEMTLLERFRKIIWNLKYERYPKPFFCGRCKDGFDCTAHCCPKRCYIHPRNRFCPDQPTYNNCLFQFKDRKWEW